MAFKNLGFALERLEFSPDPEYFCGVEQVLMRW